MIVKFLATFKQNAEAQFSLISFKQHDSALRITPMVKTDKSWKTYFSIQKSIVTILRRQFQNLKIKARCSKKLRGILSK